MSSPCAACKFLRRKCTTSCVFAPYFPPENPARFSNVHKVFGASNVAKLLNDLLPPLREDAVNSLAYEAEMRLKNPVYGCVAYISFLQLKIKQVELDLSLAKKELASYIGPAGFSQFLIPSAPSALPFMSKSLMPATSSSCMALPFENGGIGTMLGLGSPGATSSQNEALLSEQQQRSEARQILVALHAETQQLRALQASKEQEAFRLNAAFERMRKDCDGHNFTNGEMVLLPPSSDQSLPHHQAFEGVFLMQQPSQNELQLQSQMQVYMQQHKMVESDEGRNCVGSTLP